MLREQYPRATARLEAAATAERAVAATWSGALDQGLFAPSVQMTSRNTGTVQVAVMWPPGDRAAATMHLREFVTALWDALDELVRETIEMFAVQRTPRRPDADHFFPIADSPNAYEDLLAASCIDGTLREHAGLIRICQQFAVDSDPTATTIRRALARLLAWSQQLDDGMQISTWGTPTNPEVRVAPPATLQSVQPQPPGEVTASGLVVARFVVSGVAPRPPAARPNTYLDLYWPADPPPNGEGDHLPHRADECLRAVLQIAAQFAAISDQVAGARALLPAPSIQDIDPAKGRLMTDEEAAQLRASESKVALVVDRTGPSSIVVATPEGILQRPIPRSSTLRAYDAVGAAAETAVRDAVATWGLPDFAMRADVERKGSGVREIGDGIVITGNRGLILQVKRRTEASTDPAKEHSWVGKQIVKAGKQVDGTRRRLAAGLTDLTNGRGAQLRIDTAAIDWLGMIIIDHPDDALTTAIRQPDTHTPVVVLTRRDWEFLFSQLRATRAVVDYLFRVETSAERLHDETARYFEHAVLDAEASPAPPAALHAGLGTSRSYPQLPILPAGSEDPVGYGMYRLICEDIAAMPLGAATEEQLLDVLATLDQLHTSHRAALGRLLQDALHRPSTDRGHPWQFRTFLPDIAGGTQLAFGTCAIFDKNVQAAFRAWAELRHQERGDREDLTNATTIGVLLTPRLDGRRDWDTTLLVLQGDLETPADTLQQYRALWGRRGHPSTAA